MNPDHAQDATREKLLAAAHRQFAARGYYGASIAQIAGEVGLTKQALLYHFRRKEDLYSHVLKGIAGRLLAGMRAEVDASKAPEQQFENVILGIYKAARSNPLDNKVLMRELLDDQRKDAPPSEWFFKTFIDEIVAVLDKVEGISALSHSQKVARVLLAPITSLTLVIVPVCWVVTGIRVERTGRITTVRPILMRSQSPRAAPTI